MATPTIENRVTRLERTVEALLAKNTESSGGNWLGQWFGAFQDSPEFDAAMERGAEYRRSQPPAADLADDDVST